jgi:Fe-S-cluster containining protein
VTKPLSPFIPIHNRVADAQAQSAALMERTQPAEVACGGCTLCCRSGELILVTEDDPDYPYDTREIVVGERTFLALQVKADGSCVYVTDTGCAIHGHAPLTCQVFDCGALYASTTRAQRRATIGAANRSFEGRAYVKALYARGRELHRLRIGLEEQRDG